MIAGKIKRCIRCMRPLGEGEICPFCGWDNQKNQTPPYCLAAGTCLNRRYYTGMILGEGGFGITYIGWDQTLSIPVAIKEYYPKELVRRTAVGHSGDGAYCYDDSYVQGAYQKGLRAFLQEAKNLARFNQLDGVAVVRDYFTENDTAYIVMDYIDGNSIEKYVKENGRISADRTIKMLRPVMDTLQIMHENHMIHRDVSGDNLLVTRQKTAKLVDFGSARRIADQEHTVTVMYKRGYAPEEQYRMKGKIGPWTDIYSICVVMYYMISGIMPEEAPQRMLADRTVPLAELGGVAITQEQSDAIAKGMAVLAQDRFADMGQLLLALGEEPMTETELQDYMMPEEPEGEEERESAGRESRPADVTVTTEMVYRELASTDHSHRKKQTKKKLAILLAAVVGVGILILVWTGFPKGISRRQDGRESLAAQPETPVPSETAAALTAAPPTPEKITGKMPGLTGLSLSKAQKKLKKAGFAKIKLKYRNVDTGKNKIVLKQNIPADQQIQYRKCIVLTISRKVRPAVTTPRPREQVSRQEEQEQRKNSEDKLSRRKQKAKKNVVGSLDALLDE